MNRGLPAPRRRRRRRGADVQSRFWQCQSGPSRRRSHGRRVKGRDVASVGGKEKKEGLEGLDAV